MHLNVRLDGYVSEMKAKVKYKLERVFDIE